jgi:hypothetical protein
MKDDGLQARLQHGSAELRAACPWIDACRPFLEQWQEGGQTHYSLRLEIRWPQHQSLVSGPARDSAEQAIQAGFDAAERSLTRHA